MIGHRLAGAAAFSRRHDREIAALAVPALGALAADPLVSLIDTAWVGRLGAAPLGALGVASAVFAVSFFFLNSVHINLLVFCNFELLPCYLYNCIHSVLLKI